MRILIPLKNPLLLGIGGGLPAALGRLPVRRIWDHFGISLGSIGAEGTLSGYPAFQLAIYAAMGSKGGPMPPFWLLSVLPAIARGESSDWR